MCLLSYADTTGRTMEDRFPYLKTEHLSREERNQLMGRLVIESEHIQEKFAIFVRNTGKSLEKEHINLESFKLFISGFISEIEESDNSITKVLWRIAKCRYWSFFNYRIIAIIIDEFGTDSDKERLKVYQSDFKNYCRRRLCEVPADYLKTDSGSNTMKRLCVKTDKLFDVPADDVHMLEQKLSDMLGTNLCLINVKEGCVLLVFNCLAKMDDIFPLSDVQRSKLAHIGVLRIYSGCNEYYFRDTSLSHQSTAAALPFMQFSEHPRVPHSVKGDMLLISRVHSLGIVNSQNLTIFQCGMAQKVEK